MIRARSLLSLAFALSSLAMLTVSCGSDELTHSSDDGGSDAGEGGGGGKGGRGGSGGSTVAGNAGRGGNGTAGTSSTTGNLGKACSDVTNCGTGLQCDVQFLPAGLCTAECTTDGDCQPFGNNAACLADICFEGCPISNGGIGSKCQGREDLACTVYDIVEGISCTDDAECGADSACLDNTCITGVTACLPSCATDADCPGGVCDLGSGSCAAERNPGLPIGSACTPGASDDDDPCEGFCLRAGPGPNDGFCSGYCRWTPGVPGCGYDENSTDIGATCLFASALLPNADEGDTGFCGELCDCDGGCKNPNLQCIQFLDNAGTPFTAYDKKGYCAMSQAGGDPVLPACEGGGAGAGGAGGESGGGAGGTGPSSSGAGGDGGTTADAGSGGTPTGDSGSGGSGG